MSMVPVVSRLLYNIAPCWRGVLRLQKSEQMWSRHITNNYVSFHIAQISDSYSVGNQTSNPSHQSICVGVLFDIDNDDILI